MRIIFVPKIITIVFLFYKQFVMLQPQQQKFQEAIKWYLGKQKSGNTSFVSLFSQQTAQEFDKYFDSSFREGLTQSQAIQNRQKYGENVFKKKEPKTLCQIFIGAISDEMLIVLMVAAIVSIVVEYFFGEDKSKFWIEGVSILFAVGICSIVATANDYQKNKQFAELDQLSDQTFKYDIIRNGKNIEVHRSQIVAGDVIVIRAGMQVPADSMVFEAVDLIMDESQLTGQSHEVYKNTYEKCQKEKNQKHPITPIMISGSTVKSGQGKMLAVIVGEPSEMGQFYQLIFSKDDEAEDTKTPLEEKLEELAIQIGHFGMYSALTIFIILIIRLIIDNLLINGFDFQKDIGQVINYLIISVAIIVMAVPEGLPLAVTLTLAYSMKKMYEENSLVRKLISCQTMGGVHYICTDKTGTITQNKMFTTNFINTDNMTVGEGVDSINFGSEYKQILTDAIFHNSSSYLEPEKGAQTEIALMKFGKKYLGKTEIQVRESVSGYFKRLPFNSNRKRMTTGVTTQGKNFIFTSGASEVVLKASKNMMEFSSSKIIPINRLLIEDLLKKLTRKGLRTVAVGYKLVGSTTDSQVHKRDGVGEIEPIERDGFTLLGIFGIQDLPRPESKPAIQSCRNAGVTTIMVTGDNKDTAKSISEQVNIIDDSHRKIMEGDEFERLLRTNKLIHHDESEEKKKVQKVDLESEQNRAKFQNIVQGLAVVARAKPHHKYLLVDGLIKLNNVVAVTGDGTNDAPALIRADVGFAMGITGTQIAKNASDIIILDDRFDSIVQALVWGRNIYECVKKFLQFQLTVSFVAVILSVIASALIRQSVLSAVQMLWVNLIMDSLASLALATEPPDREELLKQKPNNRDDFLLTPTMMKHIAGQTIFQVAVLMFLLFAGPTFLPEYPDEFDDIIGTDLEAKYYQGQPEGTMVSGQLFHLDGSDDYQPFYQKYHVETRHFTFLFNVFVFLQCFNFFCCRRIKDELNLTDGLFRSWIFWAVVVTIVGFQILIMTQLEEYFKLYQFGGLTIQQWIISVGIGALTVPMSFILRLVPFAKPKTWSQQKTLNDVS